MTASTLKVCLFIPPYVKFIYSEKATKTLRNLHLFLTGTSVAFSEDMNFKKAKLPKHLQQSVNTNWELIKLMFIIFRLSIAKNARISSCSRIGTNIKAWGFITVMHTSDLNYCSKLVHSFAQNIIPPVIAELLDACS